MGTGSSTPEFKRPRHAKVWRLLEALNSELLADARCFFGGGTRIVLALGEYRQSADVDLLCADRAGYRALRETVRQQSLGAILKSPVMLLREVRVDRYGIRTILDVEGDPIKFDIIAEGRIALEPAPSSNLPVPALDETSCFAEKFLANADRGADLYLLSRDAIDLAFMHKAWGDATAAVGLQRAIEAYGNAAVQSLREAVGILIDDREHFSRCVRDLAVANREQLRSSLHALARFANEHNLHSPPLSGSLHGSAPE